MPRSSITITAKPFSARPVRRRRSPARPFAFLPGRVAGVLVVARDGQARSGSGPARGQVDVRPQHDAVAHRDRHVAHAHRRPRRGCAQQRERHRHTARRTPEPSPSLGARPLHIPLPLFIDPSRCTRARRQSNLHARLAVRRRRTRAPRSRPRRRGPRRQARLQHPVRGIVAVEEVETAANAGRCVCTRFASVVSRSPRSAFQRGDARCRCSIQRDVLSQREGALMRRIRIVGLCLVAVFAMSALATTAAQAGEYGKCVKQAEAVQRRLQRQELPGNKPGPRRQVRMGPGDLPRGNLHRQDESRRTRRRRGHHRLQEVDSGRNGGRNQNEP